MVPHYATRTRSNLPTRRGCGANTQWWGPCPPTTVFFVCFFITHTHTHTHTLIYMFIEIAITRRNTLNQSLTLNPSFPFSLITPTQYTVYVLPRMETVPPAPSCCLTNDRSVFHLSNNNTAVVCSRKHSESEKVLHVPTCTHMLLDDIKISSLHSSFEESKRIHLPGYV